MLSIYKASAGSGKTYRLTYTYIKFLLGEKDPTTNTYRLVARPIGRHRAILAITFTNKATDEMKSRIIERLTELATHHPCAYEDDLCRELHCGLAHLQESARLALGSLLADYNQFNVSTIDSFFQGVLRTFARELNLAVNYEVDLDKEHAVTIGVREMLSSINYSHNGSRQSTDIKLLTKWLSDYMQEQLSRGKNVNLFRPDHGSDMIVTFVKTVLNETYRLNQDAIAAYNSDPERIRRFNKVLAEQIESIGGELNRRIDKLATLVANHNYDTAQFQTWMYSNLKRWRNGDYEIKSKADAYNGPVEGRYAKTINKKPITPIIIDEIDQALCEALEYGYTHCRQLQFYTNLHDNIFNFGILAEVERKTAEYLRENQSILLDNTQSLLRNIISDDETPFIYERIGMQLRHFLIDEFQDTSRLQWLNLSPLVENSVDSGNDNLIIGDEKQSIYRFRNSDPNLIIRDVPEQFDGRDDSALMANLTPQQRAEKIKRDNTNYRSAREIVAFNNSLFALMAREKGLQNLYANVAQTINNMKLPGYVTFTPYGDEKQVALDNMANHIKRQLASGYHQRDIAILVNIGSDGVLVVNFLLERAKTDPGLSGLQIVTQEALLIDSAASVKRIVAVLRFIDAMQSVNNTAKGRRTPQQQLAAICSRVELLRSKGATMSEALVEAFSDDTTLDQSALKLAESEYVTLTSMVELIINSLTTAEERDRDNIYLSAFQDQVVTFSSRGARGLHQFIKWWDETGSQRSVDVPINIDAINVMTIHKSKGLEFKCVHIPLLNWPSKKQDSHKWFTLKDPSTGLPTDELRDTTIFDPDDVPPMMPLSINSTLGQTSLANQYQEWKDDVDIDNLNKTYVAFTRAERELIVGYPSKAADNKNKESSTETIIGASGIASSVINALRQKEAAYHKLRSELQNFDEDTADIMSNHINAAGEFTYGSPTTPQTDKNTNGNTKLMPHYVTYPNPDIWQINTLEDIDDLQTARHEGIVLHDIMAGIRHVDDVARSVRRSVMRGYLDPDKSESTIENITKAITDPKVIRWFEGYTKLLVERHIANVKFSDWFKQSGRKVPHSIPDRIVWLPDGTIEVIDYKFGDERESYTTQVRDYVHYISCCFPEATAVRGYLWHPFTGEMRLIE